MVGLPPFCNCFGVDLYLLDIDNGPPGFSELPDNAAAHSVLHVFVILAGLLTMAGPILIPVALVWGFVQPFANLFPQESTTGMRIARLASCLLILAIVSYVYFSDPFGAVDWIGDSERRRTLGCKGAAVAAFFPMVESFATAR